MLYDLYAWNRAMLAPWSALAGATAKALTDPKNPWSNSPIGRTTAAACDLFERATRTYAKPGFELTSVRVGGVAVPVQEEVVHSTPFCKLLHFRRAPECASPRDARGAKALAKVAKRLEGQPRVLVVAPLSGHYASLLRDTVSELARRADVYVTDWEDAANVPKSAGSFSLDDYIDHVRATLQRLGPGTQVLAVCQPTVPVLAAVALMNEDKDPAAPKSMVLMGGPIDTRINPTKPNLFAKSRPLSWFRDQLIYPVPPGRPGEGRLVYPGFIQLGGFVSTNVERHARAHCDYYGALVAGVTASIGKHRKFYDDYNAVMDLHAEYYLDTIERIFQKHELATGEFRVRGRRVDLGAIDRTALMTVEGGQDDISGVGQTRAAHALLSGLPASQKVHHEEAEVGHYGVFSGRRWRERIAPRVEKFLVAHAK